MYPNQGIYVKRKLPLIPLLALLALAGPALAASPVAHESAAKNEVSISTPKERASVTHGVVRIAGKPIRYTATAGTILLRGKKNRPIASMFYVAYTRDGVHNLAKQPVTFLYNGGPGSSTIWLHMGGIGPFRVNLKNGQATAPAPYSVTANHQSLLNDSDLVFIDAVGTGYSHVVGKGTGKMFWGVDEDVRSFSQFIQRYLSKYNRWNSPKFLYGESYGTTRSAALVNYLQNHGVAMNGVVLQSSILNYGLWLPGTDLKYQANLPTYAAIAWYHNKIPNRPASLPAFVEQARRFADGVYASALNQGDRLSKVQMQVVAQKMHVLTGLPVTYIERANLRVTPSEFRKELMLPERKSVGRYDARYAGYDLKPIASTPEFDPSDQFVSPGFTAAFHWYIRNILKWHSERPYKVMNDKVIYAWDWKHGTMFGRMKYPLPYVAGDLGAALRKNPYLRVLSVNGYFDLATPFHATEYDLDHMMLEPKLRSHVESVYYDSGHMIYLNPIALQAYKKELTRFYTSTLQADGISSSN